MGLLGASLAGGLGILTGTPAAAVAVVAVVAAAVIGAMVAEVEPLLKNLLMLL